MHVHVQYAPVKLANVVYGAFQQPADLLCGLRSQAERRTLPQVVEGVDECVGEAGQGRVVEEGGWWS